MSATAGIGHSFSAKRPDNIAPLHAIEQTVSPPGRGHSIWARAAYQATKSSVSTVDPLWKSSAEFSILQVRKVR
jgi:hypothetical protein